MELGNALALSVTRLNYVRGIVGAWQSIVADLRLMVVKSLHTALLLNLDVTLEAGIWSRIEDCYEVGNSQRGTGVRSSLGVVKVAGVEMDSAEHTDAPSSQFSEFSKRREVSRGVIFRLK